MKLLILVGIILYYILGAVVNGLMHRYDPVIFTRDDFTVCIVVMGWIILVPLYWFVWLVDRCIYWFEKK